MGELLSPGDLINREWSSLGWDVLSDIYFTLYIVIIRGHAIDPLKYSGTGHYLGHQIMGTLGHANLLQLRLPDKDA